MKTKLFYFFITLIILISLWLLIGERLNNQSDNKNIENQRFIEVNLGSQPFLFEIAKTETEREQGLSNRKNLPEKMGLLFVFDKPDFYYFWMKEMNFPIDIIWLDENKKIVDITTNLATSTYPNKVISQKPALFVLEINAGLADKYNLKIGDALNFKIN